ncbi:HEAT repeat domain-containing protein [Streptomyces sp. NPDC050738]|uniref:HEAT repeat domain-containing protein n=1 Tax=Streptomyces sp. NPDC050738 TaxID=3154744 RepID=UPI00343FDF24
MIKNLDGIDWSSMNHAYGPADDVPMWLQAMTSADAEVRSQALSDFYGAAHHQGDVYRCTTASLPFLFSMAGDATHPDRASIVGLLVSIGEVAVERSDQEYYDDGDGPDYTGSALVMRERAEDLVAYALDAELLVRRAAIPGLALFLDDASRAAQLLRARLVAEEGLLEQLLVVETMATLGLRLSAALDDATTWLTGVAQDAANDPALRLAALVHGCRSTPGDVGEEVVPEAVDLLQKIARKVGPVGETRCSGECTCDEEEAEAGTSEGAVGVPPQIAAAFADLDRHHRIHAPITPMLRTLHEVLEGRVPGRTALLVEQLRSPDPGARLDAVRMSGELVRSRRGDHTMLLRLVAEQLASCDPYTAAEVAEVLGTCHVIAQPVREHLAAYVSAHRTTHGPEVWATGRPLLRRAHQEAVLALARLGDVRALPGLLTALDSGVDAWRAVQVAGHLPQAAAELVPRLRTHLERVDHSEEWPQMSARALLSALGKIGDPAAVPTVTAALTAAVHHEQWTTVAAALDVLAGFGPAAGPVLDVVRTLTGADDPDVRVAAAAALWAAGGATQEAIPLLHALLGTHRKEAAADVLGRIGPDAAVVLPRLRELLRAGYEWTRVHAAAALWDIGGEPEAELVLETLLAAWEENGATANHVVACLDRMDLAAMPAARRIRAELEQTRRGGRFASIENDEELQATCRTLSMRLSEDTTAIRQWARTNDYRHNG